MGLDNYDDDIYCAQNLQSSLAEFVTPFDVQDANSVCEQLIQDKKERLKSGHVDKEPEIFTVRNLIMPCLSALGYTPRDHPGELVKDEPKKPDIRLTSLDSKYVGIAECKAINRERDRNKALESLEKRYLEENTFARYKKNLDQQYLVGIATDGFDWKIRIKDLNTGERVYERSHSLVDESRAIRHFYYNEHYQGDTNYAEKESNEWTEIRSRLAENFVSNFGVHNLPENF